MVFGCWAAASPSELTICCAWVLFLSLLTLFKATKAGRQNQLIKHFYKIELTSISLQMDIQKHGSSNPMSHSLLFVMLH
jgi:hypothetical protein